MGYDFSKAGRGPRRDTTFRQKWAADRGETRLFDRIPSPGVHSARIFLLGRPDLSDRGVLESLGGNRVHDRL